MTRDQVVLLHAFVLNLGKIQKSAAHAGVPWRKFRALYIEALRAMAKEHQPECAGFIEKLVRSQQMQMIHLYLPAMYANLTPTMDDPAFN